MNQVELQGIVLENIIDCLSDKQLQTCMVAVADTFTKRQQMYQTKVNEIARNMFSCPKFADKMTIPKITIKTVRSSGQIEVEFSSKFQLLDIPPLLSFTLGGYVGACSIVIQQSSHLPYWTRTHQSVAMDEIHKFFTPMIGASAAKAVETLFCDTCGGYLHRFNTYRIVVN